MGNLELVSGSLFANRFEIEAIAGSGGMGTVYRARDRNSGHLVALKLPHQQSAGSPESLRFAREAQILSELRHPGIVSHIAHGQTPDGQPFLVMEWLRGEDLGHRLRRGPLSLRDSLRLLKPVAEAVDVAHRKGIIHRDRSHKPKIGLRTGHSALHRRRTDYAFLPRPHAPSWLPLA